jgi:hypothetical protein
MYDSLHPQTDRLSSAWFITFSGGIGYNRSSKIVQRIRQTHQLQFKIAL